MQISREANIKQTNKKPKNPTTNQTTHYEKENAPGSGSDN